LTAEKLTLTVKKKITDDWASAFPSLEIWKPMWLVRRHGPMLYGICLDRAAQQDAYIPTVFTHCLASPFPVISLTGRAFVPDRAGQPTKIRLMSHAEKLPMIADLLLKRHPALVNGDLTLDDLLSHYYALLRGAYGVQSPYMTSHFAAMALSASVLGQKDVARGVVDRAAEIMKLWPEGVNTAFGPAARWVEQMLDQISHPAALHEFVREEVGKHKLNGLRDRGLGIFSGSRVDIEGLGG